MPWDDELEKLTNQVIELFGEDALHAATDRAAARMGTELARHGRDVGNRLVTGPSDVFYEPLRDELRRLLTRH